MDFLISSCSEIDLNDGSCTLFDSTDDPAPNDVFERLNEKDLRSEQTKPCIVRKELFSKVVSVKKEIYTLKNELGRLEELYSTQSEKYSHRQKRFINIKMRRCRIRFSLASKRKACGREDSIYRQERKWQSPEPMSKPCVSVLFSDIVGFTKICSTLSAQKVFDLLRRLYTRFDALAAQHGVTNVDIIGDAYMAATNLHDDQHSDHAARLARFAIDAVRAAQDTPIDADSPDSPSVQIRVGVHCGPVSACVLGAHGGKLTLVGDTVNVASRMESCSIPGHVQCSEAAAALIARQAPDVELEPRAGGVHVKGKGQMRTCWVGSASSGRGSGLSGARLWPPRRWSSKPVAGLSLTLACGPSVDALRHIGCLRRASLSLSK